MNKGFTLVELLAILVILTALFLLTSTLVGPVIDNSKESLSEIQIKKIEESAKAYYLKEGLTEEQYVLAETNACVNVTDLIDNGYIDKDEIAEPESGEKITGSVKIIYRANNYSYEYQDKTCSKRDKGIICEAVTETTVGNVPKGDFTPGDKYECEVKPGTTYNFYVLNTEEDKVNLIMDRNICEDGTLTTVDNTCLVAWGSSGANINGPVTAMQYIHNATKDWSNIPNIIINYIDGGTEEQGGYGGIKTDSNITTITKVDGTVSTIFTNLKARLPYGSEVVSYDGNNGYIYDYLVGSPDNILGSDGAYIQKNEIDGIEGYWVFDADHYSFSSDATLVWYNGFSVVYSVDRDFIGVRPVISLYKNQLD